MTDAELEVEMFAEALSWTSGEMTRWSETAHPDHNRWSWQGDGHGQELRHHFRQQAAALIAMGFTCPTSPGQISTRGLDTSQPRPTPPVGGAS